MARAAALRPASVTLPGARHDRLRRHDRSARAAGGAVPRRRARYRAFDAACSRFRADSELSRVERVSRPLGRDRRAAVRRARRRPAAAVSTGGLVDPTVGGSLLALGYRRDFWSSAPSPRAGVPRRSGRPLARGRARHASPGGCARPRASRSTSERPRRRSRPTARPRPRRSVGGGVLVSLGGDISVGGAPPATGWIVRVERRPPRAGRPRPGRRSRSSRAVSRRRARRSAAWTRGGVPVHHIVDPATGAPADPVWRTVSVAARHVPRGERRGDRRRSCSARARPGWLAGALAARAARAARAATCSRSRTGPRTAVTGVTLVDPHDAIALVPRPRNRRGLARAPHRDRRARDRHAHERRRASRAPLRHRPPAPQPLAARARVPRGPHRDLGARSVRGDLVDGRGASRSAPATARSGSGSAPSRSTSCSRSRSRASCA